MIIIAFVFRYASKAMSRYGFTAPFAYTVFVAGVDKNLQLYVPVHTKSHINMNSLQINVQPLSMNGEKNIAHYSVWPYTTPHHIFCLRPVSENKNKLPNNRQQFSVSMNATVLLFKRCKSLLKYRHLGVPPYK